MISGSALPPLHLPCSDPRLLLRCRLRQTHYARIFLPPPNSTRGTKLLRLVLPLATTDASSGPSLPHPASAALQIETLQSYGLSEEQITAILAKFPKLRRLNVERIVKPKLEALRAAGFTDADISEILSSNPKILDRGENNIASSVSFLQHVLPSKDIVVRVLKFTNFLLTRKQQPNIEILKAHGVPDSMIIKLLVWQPRALARSTDEFAAAVESVVKLGLSPEKATFVSALLVVSYMSSSAFLRKIAVFKELGWSDDEINEAFKRQPNILNLSEENIRMKVVFYRTMVGWETAYLVANPSVLLMNLEKRIIPRCAVLNALISQGIKSRDIKPTAWRFMSGDALFCERYVKKYMHCAPQVVEAFQGKVEFKGWHRSED